MTQFIRMDTLVDAVAQAIYNNSYGITDAQYEACNGVPRLKWKPADEQEKEDALDEDTREEYRAEATAAIAACQLIVGDLEKLDERLERYKIAVTDQFHYDMRAIITGTQLRA